MYPHFKIWRPVIALAALVAAAVLATSTVTVEPDATLSEIADEHGVSVADLAAWNSLADPDRIFAGSTLVLSEPADFNPTETTVTRGDTLSAIGRRFGVSIGQLVAANDLGDPDRILAGTTLSLLATETTESEEEPETADADSAARTHTVAPGDSLSVIAETYGVKAGVLARDNGISDPDQIVIGTVLSIGAPADAPADADPTPESEAPDAAEEEAAAPEEEAPDTAEEEAAATEEEAGDTAEEEAAATTTTTTAPTTTSEPATNEEAPTDPPVLLVPMFEEWSGIYRVPQDLLEAIAWHESDWRADAVGPDGHLGVTQLSPDTVDLIEGGLIGRPMDPLDPEDGVQMGARYLRFLLDRTTSEAEAVAAWHQGLDSVLTGGINDSGAAYVTAIAEIRLQRS